MKLRKTHWILIALSLLATASPSATATEKERLTEAALVASAKLHEVRVVADLNHLVPLPSRELFYRGHHTPEMQAEHFGFTDLISEPGGPLGTVETFNSTVQFTLADGLTVALPAKAKVYATAQNPEAEKQVLQTEMAFLAGSASNKVFSHFTLKAGREHGFPSPGQTTLIQNPDGTVSVYSWFNVGFRIEWEGAAGGPLAGKSGVEEGSIPMIAGPAGGGTEG